ncbi:glycosyltransferase [Clavibacter michiganensis]|nr:glycosyltransferase [Clavibacter michiganensis]
MAAEALMRALLYANTDGVANMYHGSGVQTRILMDAWACVEAKLQVADCGRWDLHVAVHDWTIPSSDYRVDDDMLESSLARANASGIRIHRLPHDARNPLWAYAKWAELSSSAADLLSQLAEEYDQVLFIGVDVPYALVRECCENTLPGWKLDKILFALAFHSSAVVDGQGWIPGREALEREYVRRANEDASTFITTLTPFFDGKIERDYGARSDAWMRLGHGVSSGAAEMAPYTAAECASVVEGFGIDRTLPLVVHFGRDHPMKRIPFAIEAVSRVRRPCHLVLIAAIPGSHELDGAAPHAVQLRREIESYDYITRFERELPRALAGLPETVAFLLSAEGEPMGQIPQEVACWSRDAAPVIVAPRHGGYQDQLADGETGFMFDVTDVESFTGAIERAMDAPVSDRRRMSAAMREQVLTKFDAATNFSELLVSIEAGAYGRTSQDDKADAE